MRRAARSLFLVSGTRRLKRRWKLLGGLLSALGLALCVALLWPMDTQAYLRGDASPEMLDSRGRPLYAYLNDKEEWRFERGLDRISPYLIRATLAAEDQRFYRHPGVDPIAVARAIWQNTRGGRSVSGASTLTMQVIKRHDGPAGSLFGKAVQTLQAARLEWRAPKDEILAAYLNSVSYGSNLVGCEAAALRFFGKTSAELTLDEAALLAGLPKAPGSFNPLKRPDRALRRRDYALRRMRDEGFIADSELRRALERPSGAAWRPFPSLAPHLAMRLMSFAKVKGAVRTTLDRDIQSEAERLALQAVGRFGGQITNAAVIVADVAEGSILARVGSADFLDTPGGGQFDACRAGRSPGSTLKPFAYGLAMERDRLYASETLLDDPLDYGLYQPENMDRKHRGLVTAAEALRRSLNIPAVTVLDRIGGEGFLALLRGLGLRSLKDPADRYGLGLALGDCEASLEDLTGAYSAIANLGQFRPLRFLPQPNAGDGHAVLSRGVCLALYEMLEQPLPGEGPQSALPSTSALPRVCWKTGTSTGRHDAWAFVFNAQYVVGVWMGNNDGAPSIELAGAHAALPVAGRLFRSLPIKSRRAWPEAGDDLASMKACAISGLPASAWCRSVRTAIRPRGQFENRICDMHYPLRAANGGEGIRERWPGAAKGWDLARIETSPGPKTQPQRQRGLRILAPSNGAEYILTGQPGGDAIRLRTSLDSTEAIHWYLDGRYLGASEPESPLLQPLTGGLHRLTCMTSDGGTDLAEYSVNLP